MPVRVNILFQFETAPLDLTASRPHVGAWSEQLWFASDIDLELRANSQMLQKRAAMLPAEAEIIGYRKEKFNFQGNRMVPAGTVSFNKGYPGEATFHIDAPQVSLGFVGSVNNSPNRNRFFLRALPDDLCVKGEYQPTPEFAGLINRWAASVIAMGAGFVGRNTANAASRVNLIAGNVVTLSADPGANVGDYLRFFHVKADNTLPVKGTYLVTAKAGLTFTLQGLAGHDLTHPNGLVRKDELALYQYSSINFTRVGVRKVGRPSELYRGRRAKAR
jgi:hypothetical protein